METGTCKGHQKDTRNSSDPSPCLQVLINYMHTECALIIYVANRRQDKHHMQGIHFPSYLSRCLLCVYPKDTSLWAEGCKGVATHWGSVSDVNPFLPLIYETYFIVFRPLSSQDPAEEP